MTKHPPANSSCSAEFFRLVKIRAPDSQQGNNVPSIRHAGLADDHPSEFPLRYLARLRAEPSAEGFRQLARVGIHTVLDLRAEGGRATLEEHLVRSLGMQYMNVPLAGYQAPTPAQIAVALRILENPLLAPVFVHCRRGADRTGTIMALYRIVHDHWTNQQALDEARHMRMASRERLMEQLILQYHPQP